MAEYIEREALIADLEKRYCEPCEAEGKDCNHVRCLACWIDDMMGEIENAPAADVAPVVHGEWVEYENEQDRGFHYCSCCKAPAFNYLDGSDICEILSKHCYDCGAKMDGERKGDDD